MAKTKQKDKQKDNINRSSHSMNPGYFGVFTGYFGKSRDYADDRCEGEVKRRRSAEPQHSHSSSRINGDSDKHSKREQSRDRLDGHAKVKEEAAEDGPHKSKSKEKSKNKDKTRDKYP
uniref:Uncharacterized protein n=1 Tax=Magallana gigas TaxID=29159 RepID=K1QF79_MAGGI